MILALLMLAGSPAEAGSKRELEARVTALEVQLAMLQSRVAACETALSGGGTAAAAAPGPTAAEEAAAADLLTEAEAAWSDLHADEAKALLARITAEYPNTRTATRARKLTGELAVVGTSAGALDGISMWYSGNATLNRPGITILVFWEAWCPHCQREMPLLAARYDDLHGKGVEVIGLTKVTKSSTDEKVRTFLTDNHVGFPNAKEDGTLSERFAVSGIPASVVVRDGTVIWRGHPAKLDDAMIAKILALK